MNPMKHRYLDKWLSRMLSYSNRFWKATVPGSVLNPLRKTRNWKGEEAPYLMPVRQKVEDLKDEIRKQLSNLNDFAKAEKDSHNEPACGALVDIRLPIIDKHGFAKSWSGDTGFFVGHSKFLFRDVCVYATAVQALTFSMEKYPLSASDSKLVDCRNSFEFMDIGTRDAESFGSSMRS